MKDSSTNSSSEAREEMSESVRGESAVQRSTWMRKMPEFGLPESVSQSPSSSIGPG